MSKKRSKKLRWKIVNSLPKFIRFQIIRNMFKADYNLPSEYTFKIAETKQEIEQAFTVLYDSYLEQGLMDTNENRIRVTKYHALPSTTMLIVKHHDEVIATMSAISDSPLGLPLESCWDISSLRNKKLKLVEVGALAIKSGFRSKQGKILLPFCKFMMEYTYNYMKVDGAVISINANVKDFYRAILLFKSYEGSGKKKYGFVKGDVGDSVWLPFATLPEDFKKVYSKKPKPNNMYHYIWEFKQSNFIYPESKYFKTACPVLTPDLLDLFFKKKSEVLATMSNEERMVLKRAYFYNDFSYVIDSNDHITERRYPRFAVHCPATIAIKESQEIQSAVMQEVSRKGFALGKLHDSFKTGSTITLNVDLGPEIRTTLLAKVVWVKDLSAGFEIIKDAVQWIEFINYLEAELQKKPLEIAA
jgi:hypothetical protein